MFTLEQALRVAAAGLDEGVSVAMSQFDKRLRARGATDQERADALEEYERDLQAWRSESLASIESKLREGGAQ